VCGEWGLLGDDEADIDTPGTLVNCRLDELDDRFICIEEVIESPNALLESFIM
jgi:hypothetical protein